MKSIIVAVLLIAAVGAGVYFLFFNKKENTITNEQVQKELIIGKWKLDSLIKSKEPDLFSGLGTLIDSNFKNYSYQFQKDGKIIRLLKDSVQKDTTSFEWKEKQLVLKQQGDSSGTLFTVSKLNQDSLVLLSKDSSVAYFTKLK